MALINVLWVCFKMKMYVSYGQERVRVPSLDVLTRYFEPLQDVFFAASVYGVVDFTCFL